jgi:hypothetical protein
MKQREEIVRELNRRQSEYQEGGGYNYGLDYQYSFLSSFSIIGDSTCIPNKVIYINADTS